MTDYVVDAPYLAADVVDYLAEQGAVLVGIDAQNIDNTEAGARVSAPA